MCGIVGFAGRATTVSLEQIEQRISVALDSVKHRGPDGMGWTALADAPVVLGHTRLSVIDLAQSSSQPMSTNDQQYWLTFNGEIYNYQQLRKELESEGVNFSSAGDTEVLLYALSTWGIEKTLNSVKGMFAFAFVDCNKRVLTLARDRFGEKPLFYVVDDGTIFFASEIKAINSSGFHQKINNSNTDGFLTLMYSPIPQTEYLGVQMLEPGMFLQIPLSKKIIDTEIRANKYFDVYQEALAARKCRFTESITEAVRTFHEFFDESVSQQMISDVPLGAFLSGGIDSSLVVSSMAQHHASVVRTFSIGFAEEAFNESNASRKIAEFWGTKHTEFIVTDADALSVIPQLPLVYDDPFGDSSAIPTYLLSKLASRYVTVALTGDGGDELFGGYNRYVLGTQAWKQANRLPRAIRGSISSIFDSIPAQKLDLMGDLLSRRGRFLFDGRLSARRAKVLGILNSEKVADLYAEIISHHADPEANNFRVTDWLPSSPRGLTVAEEMMLWDTQTYLPGDILTKVDRAAMANSLETRVPFLDPQLFEFAWSLPLEYKIRNRDGKYILKEALATRVPREIWDRPKKGFAIPLADWLRGGLKEWAEDLLFGSSPYKVIAREDHLRTTWENHQSGTSNNQDVLWNILMLKMWLNKWAPST